MKKALVALITVATIGSAHAWGPREQGALAGIAGVLIAQQISQPRVTVQPPVQVGYPGMGYPQPQMGYPQPQIEMRMPPVYNQAYPAPSWGVSCVPAYTQFGQYIGCVR